MNERFEEIKNKITNGDLGGAIVIIRKHLYEVEDMEFKNSLRIICFDYNSLLKLINKGTIGLEVERQEKRTIASRILNLLH